MAHQTPGGTAVGGYFFSYHRTPEPCLQKSLGAAEPIINDEHPLNLVFSSAVLSFTSSAEFALQKIAGWRLRSWAWFRGPTSGARFRYPPSIRANRRSGQTPLYLMRRRTRVRSQPGWPEQTHLIHGSPCEDTRDYVSVAPSSPDHLVNSLPLTRTKCHITTCT
jgi:hypothetical protein